MSGGIGIHVAIPSLGELQPVGNARWCLTVGAVLDHLRVRVPPQ